MQNIFSRSCALITGATSGIGLACAEELAAKGCSLLLIGRRAERLSTIAATLREKFVVTVETAALDVSRRAQVQQQFDCWHRSGSLKGLNIIINNAGLAAGVDAVQAAKIDDWESMIDTNLKGLLYVTRMCLPYLLEQEQSHIVNIGSVAGRWVYPGGAVYCATKFAVRAFNDGLRMDLMGQRARVTNIEPGMVETEFSEVRFGGDKERARQVYQGFEALTATDIARSVMWCLEQPPHVNIQELVIFPTAQAGVGKDLVHKSPLGN